MRELVLRGKQIAEDGDGYLSLTDIWRIAGEDLSRSPARWRVSPVTKALIQALTQNSRFSAVIRNSSTKTAIYTRRGKGGGTYAHHILALAYAEYLNPQIGVEVRDLAMRFWSGDLTLLEDFARARNKQTRTDERRVMLREEIRTHNRILNAELEKIGADERWQFKEFHDAGYRGLYDGRDEDDIHELKELEKNQNILDHMSPAEGAANWFRITQAEQRVTKAEGLEDACDIHRDTGARVRRTMRDMGGVMPEDMPAADSIKAAKRRLAALKRRVGKDA